MVKAVKASAGSMNALAIPEMQDFARRVGYQVCAILSQFARVFEAVVFIVVHRSVLPSVDREGSTTPIRVNAFLVAIF